MIDVLLGRVSHPFFRDRPKLVFVDTAGQVRFRSNYFENSRGESHFDHTLASLGALGIPLSEPISTDQGDIALANCFESLLANFTLDQTEQEWTALAIAHYLPPLKTWSNKWGETFTLDDVTTMLLNQPIGKGPCWGTHQLQTLGVYLRRNEATPILSDEVRDTIQERLFVASRRLERNQLANGAWSFNWGFEDQPIDSDEVPDEQHWQLILATGHHLEWIFMAPEKLRPNDEVIARAVDWCFRELSRKSEIEPNELCPVTHALRSVYQYYYREEINDGFLPICD